MKSFAVRPWEFLNSESILMPTLAADSAHCRFRCSVGHTTGSAGGVEEAANVLTVGKEYRARPTERRRSACRQPCRPAARSRSRRCAADRARPERRAARHGQPRQWWLIRLFAGGHGLEDLFALWAHGIFLWVTVRYPNLATQRDHRSAAHGALHDLVLVGVVGESLVIAVAVRHIRPGIALGNGRGRRKRRGTHRTQSSGRSDHGRTTTRPRPDHDRTTTAQIGPRSPG